MDSHYQQDPAGSAFNHNNNSRQNDELMGGVEENLSTTPTGSHGNGYSTAHQPSRRQSTQSTDYPPSQGMFSPAQENIDPNARYQSSNPSYQQQPVQPYSRPSSGLSGSGDRYGYSQTYQEQNQRSSQQTDATRATQSSVVIKVGMVGDAQIGKTSLMVKYVEGSWDEDYIQTLGMRPIEWEEANANSVQASTLWRRLFQYETQKSPFPSGIWEVSESLSICSLWSAMTRLLYFSCSISPGRAL